MIKEYLAKISTDLNRFNQSLTKTSILIDKPWALVDDNNEVQKLIFKKNHDLILSKNGKAEIGKWEYFPEAKSLLIDRGTDKILCNEIFIDKGVIILKLDGTQNEFFALANENFVPDLDVVKYLNSLIEKHTTIEQKKEYVLEDGSKVEVYTDKPLPNLVNNNILITLDNKNIKDGYYKLKDTRSTLVVKDSRIIRTLAEFKYVLEDGKTLTILQRNHFDVSTNDYVLNNGKLVENDYYFLHKNKKILTNKGMIEKIFVRPTIFNLIIGDFREI